MSFASYLLINILPIISYFYYIRTNLLSQILIPSSDFLPTLKFML